jgi:hypothetical protein
VEDVVEMNRDINDISAVEVESEEVRWLLREPMIPLRGITIINGNRGTSKTTLACWLAAQVTAQGQNVFFASQEDDIPEFIQPRIEAAGANKDRLCERPFIRLTYELCRHSHSFLSRVPLERTVTVVAACAWCAAEAD